MKWEYQWLRVPVYGASDTAGQYDLDALDEMGALGWEAYAISEYAASMVVHLKRRRPDTLRGPNVQVLTGSRRRTASVAKTATEVLAPLLRLREAVQTMINLDIRYDPTSNDLERYERAWKTVKVAFSATQPRCDGDGQ